MTKIITCAELRSRGLEELHALFRSLEAELLRTEPGCSSARQCSPSLENVGRAMATCLARPPHPRPTP